jgi:hypothetical protein
MKVVQPVIVSNGIPCHKMKSVGTYDTSRSKKEGKKGRMGRYLGS